MKHWVLFPVVLAFTFMVACGTEDKNPPKDLLISGACLCQYLHRGLHPTHSCEHYCVCRLGNNSSPEYKNGLHRKCPTGMAFNQLIENCDKKDNFKCPEFPVPAGYKCPKKVGNFKFPERCSRFIQCQDNIPYVFFCPAALHFYEKRNKCDDPAKSNCTEPTVEYCESGTFKPHKTNCSLFFQCDHGRDVLQHCPAELHWNVKTNKCDYNYNANCDKNVISPTTTVLPPLPPTTTVLPPLTSPPPRPSCQGKEFYPHKNCSKFYHCAHGIAHEKECPSSLHWSVDTNRCDQPCFAKCEKNLTCINNFKSSSPPQGRCSRSKNYVVPDEIDCAKYYVCHDGEFFFERCGEGLSFEREKEACRPEIQVKNCPEMIPFTDNKLCTCANCFVADPAKCRRYYECNADKKGRLRNCPSGLMFNKETKQCEYIENKQCY